MKLLANVKVPLAILILLCIQFSTAIDNPQGLLAEAEEKVDDIINSGLINIIPTENRTPLACAFIISKSVDEKYFDMLKYLTSDDANINTEINPKFN